MQKIALVTGGSRGIGRKTAEVLCTNGYHTVVTGTRAEEEVAEELAGIPNAVYMQSDIADIEQSRRTLREIDRHFGRLDLLVNNAGAAPRVRADVLDTDGDSFDHVVRTNLRGTFFMCQAAAKLMMRYKEEIPDCSPRIVNISSVSAYTSSVNRGEYCISKAGISMVTALFADRLAEAGIPVFEIRPGIIRTDMTAGVAEKYDKLIREGLTPTRRWGEPDDVAGVVLSVTAGAFDFSTGQVFNVDGGFHIRRL